MVNIKKFKIMAKKIIILVICCIFILSISILIFKNQKIMAQTAKLLDTLKAGPGVITVQLILTKEKKIKFIEINPRFGGGVPLSIKAGADFPKWILAQLVGKKPGIKFDGFKNKLTMLRYDAEVWLEN